MNEKERVFAQSIKDKIKNYSINTTFEEAIKHGANKFIMTHYQDGTPDELIDIGIERFLSQKSPFYFISKYTIMILPGVGELSAKCLYYFQKEILKDFTKYKKIVLTKTRQAGLSTLTSLVFFWKITCFNDQWGVIISKDGKSSQDVLSKIKINLDRVPLFLNIKVDKNNVRGVELSNGSKIDSFARSKTSGRSCSPTICLLDECAFYQTQTIIDGIISSVVPALTKTSGSLWLVSTPNGCAPNSEGYYYYNQVQELKEEGGKTATSRLYDVSWWEIPDYPGLTPYKGYNSKLEEYIGKDYFNHPEVKSEAEAYFEPIATKGWKENEWLKFQRTTSGEVKYQQEILKNFNVVGNGVFSNDIIARTRTRTRHPIITDELDGRPLKGMWTWKLPEKDHRYGIGVDVCKGSGDDSSCIQILDLNTYEQVAEYVGRCTTHDLANYIYKSASYYNEAYVIVETNSIGEAVFNELYYNLNYSNLFKQKKPIKNGGEMWTGWMTSIKTRDLITSKFIDYYYEDDMWNIYQPHSERLLDQMNTWVWSNGRPDHNGSSHDDAILAMSIILFNRDKAVINKHDLPDFIDEKGIAITAENSVDINNSVLSEDEFNKKKNDYYHSLGLDKTEEDPAKTLAWLLS